MHHYDQNKFLTLGSQVAIQLSFFVIYWWLNNICLFPYLGAQVNYLADCSLEILDDPAAVALVEVFPFAFTLFLLLQFTLAFDLKFKGIVKSFSQIQLCPTTKTCSGTQLLIALKSCYITGVFDLFILFFLVFLPKSFVKSYACM